MSLKKEIISLMRVKQSFSNDEESLFVIDNEIDDLIEIYVEELEIPQEYNQEDFLYQYQDEIGFWNE